MPCVVFCGLPCSGKTTRSNELKTFLTDEKGLKVKIISDDDMDIDKNEVYADSKKEKDLRVALKSAVQRDLSTDKVVIIDSLNYIKGCRYELYCAIKSVQTPQCVIHCDISPDLAKEWDRQRPLTDQYKTEIFDDLVMRFEVPSPNNRWDSPLFLVHPDEKLMCDGIYDALYHRIAPPPNRSTLSQPLSATNFLHELDKITQTIVTAIMNAQKTSIPGESLLIPGANDRLELVKPVTFAELQRIRRQFISFTKTHPVEDTTKIANMFLQFLSNSIK